MKFVAYYRVSTARQGNSGLGLEAQRDAVQRLAEFRQGQIIKAFEEVESGGKNNRPQLAAALDFAKRQHATLIVAKLDRLARDAKFLLNLSDGNVPLLFGDFPDLDCTTPVGRMVLTQMASVAEFERRRISERTKAAIAASKARGTQWGGVRPNNTLDDERRAAGRAAILQRSEQKAVELYEVIQEIDPDGSMSHCRLARELNLKNVLPPSGKGRWCNTTVRRVFERIEEINERNRRVAAKSLRSVSGRLSGQSRTVCKRSFGGRA